MSRRRVRIALLGVVLAAVAAGSTAWLVAAWPGPWRGPLARGESAYAAGEYAAAADLARERLRGRPDDPAALRLLARASARQGRDEVAQGIYSRLGEEAMAAEDLALLAAGLIRLDRYGDALEVLRRGLALDPEHPEVLADLSRLLAASEKLDEAAELAGRLARRPGSEARGWLLLGLVRHRMSDPAGAAEALGRSLGLDPGVSYARYRPDQIRLLLARAQLAAGRPDDARETLRAVIDSADQPEAHWLMSRALLQRGDAPGAAAALDRAGGFGSDHPEAPEPAPYVGSARCAGCHPEIHASQQGSRHARTFHDAAEVAELPLPDGPLPDPDDPSVTHAVVPAGEGRHAFETRRDRQAVRALIAYAFGSGDRGATPVGLDDRGRGVELRLSHYGDGSGWSRTTGHPGHPAGADLRTYLGRTLSPDEVRRCLDCHTTNAFAARAGEGPTTHDGGIGCERCHGPGGNHVAAMSLGPKFPDLAVGRPRLAPAERVTALCAGCHSPKGAAVDHDDPKAIRFQGTTLTWSRCYTESRGSLTCTTCHNPHRDAETSHAYYEAKCLSCHSPTAPSPAPAGVDDGTRPIAPPGSMPRVPCPVSPSGGCVDCHMPTRGGIIPHTSFTDHEIRVHRDERAE